MLIKLAREQMIEQQVRTWDVLDESTLQALRSVPRELFVPPAWRELAFADCAIALGHGKHMLPPMIAGRILQALALQRAEQVLEIGTGSGFLSACIAQLTGYVRTLELHADLAERARANLNSLQSQQPGTAPWKAEVINADAMQFTDEARYDAVVLTASLPIYQTRFERLLRPGGRLFVIVGTAPVMHATLIRRRGEADFGSEVLFETCVEALEHAPRPPEFGF